MPYSSGLQESNACRFPFGICRLPEHRCLDLRFQLYGLFQPYQQYCCKNLCAGRMRHCLWDETIRTRFRRHTSCKNGFSQRMEICFSRPLFFCDITLTCIQFLLHDLQCFLLGADCLRLSQCPKILDHRRHNGVLLQQHQTIACPQSRTSAAFFR